VAEEVLIRLRWILVVLGAVVVQVGVAPLVRIAGVVPNVLVILAVCAGLSGGPQRGAVMGFWTGLAFDIARPVPLGIGSLTFSLIAFAAGLIQVVVLQASRIVTAAIVAAGSALGVLAYAVLGEFFGTNALSTPRLWVIIVVHGGLGAALSRVGLAVAGWADGPDARSVAQ
jgi:rod shape-determining protein MreD